MATIKSHSEWGKSTSSKSGWFLVDPTSLSSCVHKAMGLGSALVRALRVQTRPLDVWPGAPTAHGSQVV